jgi:polysaccharide biosynthesis protein PslJ
VSRTGVLMLIVAFAVLVVLRRSTVGHLWPLLLPGLLAVHLVLPGALGGFTSAFFPAGGIIAQQEAGAGSHGSGRLADVRPTLSEWSAAPILGVGFGTRVVTGPNPNSAILDDQWLSTLLETGLMGLVAWLWIFGRALKHLIWRARHDDSDTGALCAALAASTFAYTVGMLTFDAFTFIQVTFVMFVLLAFSSIATGGFRAARAR